MDAQVDMTGAPARTDYRVLVTGSRVADPGPTQQAIEAQFDSLAAYAADAQRDVIIIHGGAKGVDSIAHEVARSRLFTTVVEYPQWDAFESPGQAAYARNVLMVERWQPDVCLAFSAGTRGTAHQMAIAAQHSIPVREIQVPRV